MNTILCDTHIHTIRSSDAAKTGSDIMECCRSAIDKGLFAVAFTEHFDLTRSGRVPNMDFSHMSSNFYDSKAIFEDIAAAKAAYGDKIKILAGVELGQAHYDSKTADELLFANPYDFVIGSVHNLGDDRDLYFCDYLKEDCRGVLAEYLNIVYEMLRGYKIDSVGHLDYPLRYMFGIAGSPADLDEFEDRLDAIFRLMAQQGTALEINTRGMRQPIGRMGPTVNVIRRFKELGGECITVGSDAHHADELGYGVLQAYAIAREAGIKFGAYFENRQIKPFRI